MAFKDAKRCTAKAKRSGERCKNPAVKGYAVCRVHGANPKNRGGAPKNNLHALVHGCFVDRFLKPGEEVMFNKFMDGLKKDIPDMNESSDYAIAVTAGMVFIRLQRAIEGDAQPNSLDFLSKTLIRHLEALKITRHARKGMDINLPSPAQWALELIEKTRQRQKELDSGKEILALPGDGYNIEDTEDAELEEVNE
ncbi:MAG: hypothetical protein P9X24_15685 [Candidatus Hatepunaea meridiana]|nr:hypothetical protein [Candidatus Hatepunaea meridiana]